jgi:plasmid stabilization system protein ParE
MIASRSDGTALPRVTWRRTAKRSLRALLDFVGTHPFGDARVRERRIEEAIELLRYTPLRGEVVVVRDGLTFRRLTVVGRFLVYYIYTPPRGATYCGTISIRAVKHAASQNPFLGVREASTGHQPLAVLSIRDGGEPAIA